MIPECCFVELALGWSRGSHAALLVRSSGFLGSPLPERHCLFYQTGGVPE